MEALGEKLRRQRRRLGLTLDELAARSSISKPYLSLIETGRVPNPPSDEKLQRLEQALGFAAGELVAQAHLQRTPADVRTVLQRLLLQYRTADTGAPAVAGEAPVDLDAAYFNGVLQEIVEQQAENVEPVQANTVPIINKVAAGYPKDFTDLDYPRGVADGYLTCPDLSDPSAFAARVCGDSMMPKYHEGDVVVFSPGLVPRSGDDCFIRFEDGQTTFKRVFFESDERGKSVLRLQPRNERYRPQTLTPEKVTGLYKALYRFERVED
jgi:repressor LexA